MRHSSTLVNRYGKVRKGYHATQRRDQSTARMNVAVISSIARASGLL